MSTKFSIRPAPRKRAWICKRSPPCLEPDPIPPCVLMTYYVKKTIAPAAGLSAAGSFIAKHIGPGLKYSGTNNATDHVFTATFLFDPVTELGHADSVWAIGIHGSMGAYPSMPGTGPPSIKWSAGLTTNPADPWTGFLLVTS